MHIIKTLALILMLIFCSSCGSSETNNDHVTQSISYKSSPPGNSTPEMTYTESITLSGDTMTVVRSGGSKVLSGTWQARLKRSEVTTINGMVLQATQPEVADKVSTNIIYDAPSLSLQVGNKTFILGIVNEQLHEFPAEAATLATYVEELMTMYCGSRYTN
jgi:hypothetical protein